MSGPAPKAPRLGGQIRIPKKDCHRCHFEIMDGEALRTRVVRFTLYYAQAKCPRCKEWVRVPVRLYAEADPDADSLLET